MLNDLTDEWRKEDEILYLQSVDQWDERWWRWEHQHWVSGDRRLTIEVEAAKKLWRVQIDVEQSTLEQSSHCPTDTKLGRKFLIKTTVLFHWNK